MDVFEDHWYKDMPTFQFFFFCLKLKTIADKKENYGTTRENT